MQGLMLHAGAHTSTEDDVRAEETPAPTLTHYPIPHAHLMDLVRSHIELEGWRVEREEYALFNEGQRMFSVWALQNGVGNDDYQLALGLRNAHDKAFAAAMALGSSVFVCDNLAFSSEIVVARKHTRFIMRDLAALVATAVGKIHDARISQDQRFAAYKARELSDTEVHDLLIRSVDARAIPNSYIPKVLAEYRNPTHEEFEERTAWALFNAYTQVYKGQSPRELVARTTRLHGLMDLASGALTAPELPASTEGEIIVQPTWLN